MPMDAGLKTRAGRSGGTPLRRCYPGLAAFATLSLCCALLAGCAGTTAERQPAQPAASVAEAPIPPKDALPLDQATIALADATLLRAELPPLPPSGRYKLVIDPLIDRASGGETETTRAMGRRMVRLIREKHQRFDLRPFTTANLDEKPLILLGSIAPVAGPGTRANMTGPGRPPAYRIWAVLADLSTGRVVAHEEAWVQTDEVNPTPAVFYRDSPVWTADGAAAAYLRTCALFAPDPIDPGYLQAVRVQALVADGIRAYEARRYRQALNFYEQARKLAPADQQLRIRNGIYLANQALGREPRCRDGLRQRCGLRAGARAPGGEVRVPARLRRLLGRPGNQRPLSDVAAADRNQSRCAGCLSRSRGAQQPNRLRGSKRAPVARARRTRPQPAGGAAPRLAGPVGGGGRGVARDHRRHRRR